MTTIGEKGGLVHEVSPPAARQTAPPHPDAAGAGGALLRPHRCPAGRTVRPLQSGGAAAAGPGLPGLLSLLGVTGGALLFLDFQPGLRHAAAAVLLFAAQTAFCDTKLYRRPAFRPLTAAFSQLLIQSVYLLYRPLSQWVLCLTASALLAAATALLTAHGTSPRQKGLLYAAALSLALVPVTVEGLFSVGKALLMAELLLLSCRLPPLTAGLAGPVRALRRIWCRRPRRCC